MVARTTSRAHLLVLYYSFILHLGETFLSLMSAVHSHTTLFITRLNNRLVITNYLKASAYLSYFLIASNAELYGLPGSRVATSTQLLTCDATFLTTVHTHTNHEAAKGKQQQYQISIYNYVLH